MKEDTKGLWQRVRSLTKNSTEDSNGAAHTSGPTNVMWGETFAVVSSGLDESQVRRYVDDLLHRYHEMKTALEGKESSATVNTYLQKVMNEIQQVEDTVKTQISKDAETEASRIISDARQTAQEVLIQARKEASVLAAKEAEGILAAVKKKADIRLQSQLMMEKAQDEVKNLIRQESTEAYRRLLDALKTLGIETDNIKEEWERRSVKLWNSDDFRLVMDDSLPSNGEKDTGDGI